MGDLLRCRRTYTVLLVSLTVTAAVILLALINAATYEARFFGLSSDVSLTMIVTAALFLFGGVTALRAGSQSADGQSRTWLVIGAVGILLALEAAVGVHDRLEDIGGLEDALFIAYPVIGLVVFGLLLRPVARLGVPVSTAMLGALIALMVSQVAGGVISLYPDLWLPLFDLLMAAEEGSEMLSAALFLTGATYGSVVLSAEAVGARRTLRE